MKKLIVIVLLALSTNLTAQFAARNLEEAKRSMSEQNCNFTFTTSPDGDTVYIDYTSHYGHNTGIWYAPNGVIEWDLYGTLGETSIFKLTSYEVLSNIYDPESKSYHGVIKIEKDKTLGFYHRLGEFIVFFK